MSIRAVKQVSHASPTVEGAGVHLHRGFGFGKTSDFDPFLLFDDFRGDRPSDYIAGFPWHPHRGIETITYVLAGTVEHGDSLGNRGAMGAGDVQWMTAGSGIIHQEMPHGDADGRMHGFQLWANLPSQYKMVHPRYQDVKSQDIAEVIDDDGTKVRIICGEFWGKRGPVDGIAADPTYLDISVPPNTRKVLPVSLDRHAFAYVFAGSGTFRDASAPQAVLTDMTGELDESPILTTHGNRTLILFDRGDEVVVRSGDEGMRFLLVSGRPIEEPVAWYGPIVMNTQAELQTAFNELQKGTFIKHDADLCLTALEASRQFLARHDATESARHRQMVEFVTLVRDAMTSLAGDATEFDTGLQASAQRFDAMLRLDSLTQIKIQLTREVGELKKLTEERQQSWNRTLTGFSTRIQELEDQLQQSEQQATTDAVTGLANRATFDRTLKEKANTLGSHFVLALLDVDNFKGINDTHGHPTGDDVLNIVATCLKGAFRSEDLIARIGGDEFAALIKDVSLYQAETRICGALDSMVANRPYSADGEQIPFTLSVGLAEFSAGDTTRSLLQRADDALYDAKRQGKNRVVRREQVYFRDLAKARPAAKK